MEENQHHQLLLHHHHRRPPLQSRHTGMKGAGEIVEVQGGHIVRSIGRKDRHSKVCTAKGTRDRRVRLAAHTAIQFYDVQDRLGYDRPSKAVDWLMKNAKAAIDELDELPAWHPTASNPPPPPNQQEVHADNEPPASAAYGLGGGGGIGFLPPSLDSEAIADTIKSFFPMAAASTASSSSHPIDYRNYHPAQDLRLSLQSFQDPILLHHHHQNQIHTASGEQTFFPSSAALAFDANSASWSEQNQRMVPWNVAEIGGGGGGGYVFNLLPPQAAAAAPPHNVLGQNQFFTQRGPLQSSNTPSFRAWMDPIAAAAEHQMHTGLHPSVSAFGFASGGFSGFRVPARIQGEEEHDGMNTKPTSASSSSQH